MTNDRAVGHSTNLVGLPTDYLGTVAFAEAPRPLHIAGARELNAPLFEMLGLAEDLEEAGRAFVDYMRAMFAVDREQRVDEPGPGPRRYRSSYARLVSGWGFDSNSREGAVMKGWVESRFGIFPTWHKGRIDHIGTGTWTRYVEEKMASRFHDNSILTQLDLLYEFCQWALDRFVAPGQTHMTLHRGVYDFDEHRAVQRIDRRRAIVRLNALVSFSADRDHAGCFGDLILTARVPVQKILYFSGLLPAHPLQGEGEWLVIGGDYPVDTSW